MKIGNCKSKTRMFLANVRLAISSRKITALRAYSDKVRYMVWYYRLLMEDGSLGSTANMVFGEEISSCGYFPLMEHTWILTNNEFFTGLAFGIKSGSIKYKLFKAKIVVTD